MPKHNIFFNPGENPPERLLNLLKEFFKESDITKLERFGGRIQINLTAPFTDRKEQDSGIEIDLEYVERLRSEKNPAAVLGKLTIKQLRAISKLLNYPFSSKATKKEIANGLVSYLGSKEKWQDISGTK